MIHRRTDHQIVEHATREARDRACNGASLFAVSVSLSVGGWSQRERPVRPVRSTICCTKRRLRHLE